MTILLMGPTSPSKMMSTASSGKKTRRSGRWWVAALLVMVVIATGSWAYYSHLQTEATRAAEAARLMPPKRTQVHSLGRLEPAGTIVSLAPKSGNDGSTVDQLLVNEGDDVEAGATLAILDNQARRLAALEEAAARLSGANARLLQIKAGAKAGDLEAQQAAVLLAESQSKLAAQDLRRALELQQKQAISKELIDQRQWEVDRLQLEQRRTRGLLESLQEVRDVDVAVAESDIAAAKAAVARAQADADASVLKAPFAARVLKIHTRSGEKISDKGVLEIGNVSRMQAVAEVFEADVAILQAGMAAEVRIDSSDAVLPGQVIEIGNLVSRKVVLTNDPVSDTDARVVEVRIDLDPQHVKSVERLANARVEITIFLEPRELNTSVSVEPPVRTVSGQRTE